MKDLLIDLEQSVDDYEMDRFIDLYMKLTGDLKEVATNQKQTAHELLLDLVVIKLNQRRDDALCQK